MEVPQTAQDRLTNAFAALVEKLDEMFWFAAGCGVMLVWELYPKSVMLGKYGEIALAICALGAGLSLPKAVKKKLATFTG